MLEKSMDEVVGKLEALTNDFVKTLDTTDVDAIVKFVEDRQKLIDEFSKLREQAALFETEESDRKKLETTKIVERIQYVLSYDALINDKMQHLMDASMQQLNKINQTRKREQAYNPAYSADSIYFDKKK
jgi:hypothetical protein